MALFDFLNALNSPEAAGPLAMLAAAGPSAVPQSVGQRLFGAYMQSQKMRQDAEDRAFNKRYRETQMAEIDAQAQERRIRAQREQAELNRQAGIRDALPSLFRRDPALAMGEGAEAGDVGPTRSNAARMNSQVPQFDLQRALALRMTADEITKHAGLVNLGRPEVARVEETTDGQGRPVKRQLDKFGAPVGSDMGRWIEPKMVNQGNKQTFVDPVTGRVTNSLDIFQSPDSIASNIIAREGHGVTRRGQDMADARARETNALTREAQQSQVFDTPNGPIVINKGSGAARPVTIGGEAVKGEATLKREAGANQVLGLLDQAEKLIPKATNSYAGAAYDQARRLTGGAPDGAVAIGQLKALEGALMAQMPRMEGPQSNLDVQLYRQSAGQIGDPTVPSEIKMAAIKTVREIQQRYAGQAPRSPQGRQAPAVGAIMDGYRFKGGDPANQANWERQ